MINPIRQPQMLGSVITQAATLTASVPAGGTTAAFVIATGASYLKGILVTATGSANLVLYDNATVASGIIIGVVPSTATLGQFFPLDMPAANGITAGQVSGSPTVTVAYN